MESATLEAKGTALNGTEGSSSADRYSEAAENTDLYFTFGLGAEVYGIAVSSVKEVMGYAAVFKTPGVPDYIKGVINLRGEVVPVIDLGCRFFNMRLEVTELTCIVVVEIKDENDLIPIGVMVDSVRAVTGIAHHNLENAPEIGSRIRHDFISAIGKVDGQFVILLNVENVLNLQELSTFDGHGKKKDTARR
jgi:purine-binding chemotaxis protein CheW